MPPGTTDRRTRRAAGRPPRPRRLRAGKPAPARASTSSRMPRPGTGARPPPPRPRSRASIDLRHHVLDLRVVLERVAGQVLAVARLLEAAVRHLAHERNVV